MPKRDFQSLVQTFFRIYPDYPLCKSLAENMLAGVCSYDHAENLIYNRASGAAQNQQAIDEKLSQRKIEVAGRWKLLREITAGELGELSDESYRQAAEFYLKNPYAHGRVARPAWYRPPFTRNGFLRSLWLESRRRGMDDLVADLHGLIFLA